ncbi:MAG TPA: alpha-1,4-glucan--maltose-1-phosphate maltosyltransferase [Candidatus Tectomicrobia bacterium]|jgi:starch synthase (maltosyl-transferring)|nr:alpha-1,4-glucan--maltose-1-phosphate maltosyltransferase [Candidatus Tectomicrobia bacterium]
MPEHEGRRRVIIEGVTPEIDGGDFPIKRVRGEQVIVEADAFGDGHDLLHCILLYRRQGVAEWAEVAMEALGNDRWRGSFIVPEIGGYRYTLMAWIDRFATWSRDLAKKVEAEQDVTVDLLSGAELVEQASKRASGGAVEQLRAWASTLREEDRGVPERVQLALTDALAAMMRAHADRSLATTYGKELRVVVDRERARFSTWYEMFPRSCATEPGRHGTFKDCEARLPYVAALGFDVLYLPPVHPIGSTHRKGRNNATVAGPDDPGSPWGIGSEAGGHTAVHPALGTLDDFRRFAAKAREYDLEIALDIAFQCSPDHPYVLQHPEWFRQRPDGTVQYAENPPKKYQDIYPLDFETDQWQSLWGELKRVVLFWIEQGVRIFRVDNPHTKPLRFWAWLIDEVKRDYPTVIFLAEAFTRPKVMYYLAKCGFTQSYTYFAWRNTKEELTQYFTTLTQTEVREFFGPNLWPNTPDILTEYLQLGGRPAFMTRLVLAATLGASYGIYGPAFELCENRPREPGSEEYLNSEKYEIKAWDLDRPDSLKEFIARVNHIRRENPALQRNQNLRFHAVSNDQLICYSKHTEDHSNVILVVVNLDPHHTQSGWVELSTESLGLPLDGQYQVHDLLGDGRYLWHGQRNFVELNPNIVPAHIFRLRRRVRSERDFEYYL